MNPLKDEVQLLNIPPDQIDEGERARKDYGNLNDLQESIRERGIIHPIAVKAPADNSVEQRRYKLLAGGRRYRACLLLGLGGIPCRIYPHSISELEEKSIELAENIKRENLTYPEEVALCRQIHELQVKIYGEKVSTAKDASGWSQADTAKLLGKSPALLTSDLQLARAIEKIPALAALRNKSEALKVLSLMEEAEVKKEIATRISNAKADSDSAKLKKTLCDSFIIRDFFEGIKEIPDGTVDLVEIDPPYAIGLKEIKKIQVAKEAQMEAYNEVDAEHYIQFLGETLKQAWRVLKDNGWLILWFAPEPWFEPIYQLVCRTGFSCKRMPGIWFKFGGNYQTIHPELYLGSAYEPFFYARKHSSTIAEMGKGNVFTYHPVLNREKRHPTERPVELIEDILRTFVGSGSKVLVPFLGSGNTLLAAANLDLPAFGYELSEKYKDSFILAVHAMEYGHYFSITRKEE